MAKKYAFVVLVLSLIISTVLCQTFQYSHGWTNGKRSELPNSLNVSNPEDEFKRLKMLVHRNIIEQPLLINCNKRKLVHTDNYASQLLQKRDDDSKTCHRRCIFPYWISNWICLLAAVRVAIRVAMLVMLLAMALYDCILIGSHNKPVQNHTRKIAPDQLRKSSRRASSVRLHISSTSTSRTASIAARKQSSKEKLT